MTAIIFRILSRLWLPAALLSIGAASGGWTVYKLYSLGEVRALKQEIKEQAENRKVELSLLAEHYQAALVIERDKIKISEVVKYVKDNRQCDISPDAERLLDESRQGVSATPGRSSKGSGTVAGIARLSQRVEIQAHADCGIRYRQLSEQLAALIKWHRKVSRTD